MSLMLIQDILHVEFCNILNDVHKTKICIAFDSAGRRFHVSCLDLMKNLLAAGYDDVLRKLHNPIFRCIVGELLCDAKTIYA